CSEFLICEPHIDPSGKEAQYCAPQPVPITETIPTLTKMKITIFLLVLLISLDSVQETFGRNRRSRMSNFWRTQLSRRRNSETGR
ncbi:hypothetical protein Avbf_13931, partial [Armadillidium vulgare]